MLEARRNGATTAHFYSDTVRLRSLAHDAWVDRELADYDFVDERLGKRFRSLLEQVSSSPGDSIPLVCQDWANTKRRIDFSTMIESAKRRFWSHPNDGG